MKTNYTTRDSPHVQKTLHSFSNQTQLPQNRSISTVSTFVMALNKTTIDLKFDQNLASHTFSRKHIATKRHLRFFWQAQRKAGFPQKSSASSLNPSTSLTSRLCGALKQDTASRWHEFLAPSSALGAGFSGPPEPIDGRAGQPPAQNLSAATRDDPCHSSAVTGLASSPSRVLGPRAAISAPSFCLYFSL